MRPLRLPPLSRRTVAVVSALFTPLAAAAPVAVSDNYTVTEDIVFRPPGPPILSGTFNGGADGFTYADDTFNNTGNPNFAAGTVSPSRGIDGSGCLLVDIGRRTSQPRATSGAFRRTFTLSAAATVEVKFNYRLRTVNLRSTSTRYGEAVFTMDGERRGDGQNDSLLRINGPGQTGQTRDSEWQEAAFSFALTAGQHTMELGAYCNSSGGADQFVEALYDNVSVAIAGAGSVLLNDTGGTAPVTATKLTDPAHGSLTFAADGNFTYTPAANYHGPDSFTYRAADASGPSAPATVTFNVTPVNDAPAGAPDTYTTAEDTRLTIPAPGLLANDSDVDNPPAELIRTSLVQPDHGSVNAGQDGSFTYTPDADFNGTDTFTYRVSDGEAQSAPVTVTINVTAVPDAPVPAPDSYTTYQNLPLVVDLVSTGQGTPVTLIEAVPDTTSDPPRPGDLWNYLDNGTDQGTAWRELLFNDSAWKTGRAELGYGDAGEGRPESTVIEDNATPGYNPGDANRYITTYFRKTFELADARKISGLEMELLRDDGAVVFLNGHRVYFDDGLENAGYLTTTDGSTNNETTHIDISLPDAAQYLLTGANVIAVEIHQAEASSSDLSFDLGLTGTERTYAGVLSNDVEPDGQPLTAQAVSQPAHGTLTLNANGTFTYTPANGYQGSDSFTYRVSDGTNQSAPVTVSLTVAPPVNLPPQTGPNAYTVNEDATLTVAVAQGLLLNDSDPEGGAITAVVAGPPGNGSVTINPDGSFTYTPNPNFNGTDTFYYRASDGVKLSASTPVTVTVNPLPDVPVTLAETYRTTTGTTLLVNAASPGSESPVTLITAAPDPSSPAQPGDLWRYLDNGSDQGTAWQDPAFDDAAWKEGRGELGYGDEGEGRPEFTWVEDNATPGYNGSDSERYITTYFRKSFDVSDRSRLSALSVSLLRDDGAIIYLNGQRVFTDDNLDVPNLDYQTLTSYTMEGESHDNISLPGAAGFLVDGANVLAVEVHQNAPSSSDMSFDLGLTAVQSSYAGVLANDFDPEGDTFTATLVTPPARGTLTFNPNGTFSYTPVANFTGTDTFTYRAADATGPSAPATVTIIVSSGPNRKPLAVTDTFTTAEDATLTRPAASGVLANDSDPDNDRLTAVLVSGTSHGTVTLQEDGSFSYVPEPDYHGPDAFTYRTRDTGLQLSAAVTASITVTPVNDAPLAASDTYATDPGLTLSVNVDDGVLQNDSDPDGNPLTAQVVAAPSSGTLTLLPNGAFTYIPAATGTFTFTYAAFDGTVASPPASVTLVVNGRPVALADTYTTAEDTTLTVSAASGLLKNDTDPEGAALTATVITQPEHGTLTFAPNGSFEYVPDANYAGPDTFSYTIADGSRTSLPAAVTLNVTAVNDAPAGVADAYSVFRDTPLNVSAAPGVLRNDTDVDSSTLTVTLVTTATQGTVTLNSDGSFSYVPQTGYLGEDSFTYRVSDGITQSPEVTVTLAVNVFSDTIIISEIMFNPPDDNTGAEFIEVFNYGAVPVDMSGWQLDAGVNYTFPVPTVVPAGERLVIPADTAAFDARWSGVANRTATGWSTGGSSLSNSGENIRLVRPDISGATDTITVNEVVYSDEGDWAVRQAENVGNNSGWRWNSGADGNGQSLQLRNALAPNEFGSNWASANPTPGAANTAVETEDLAPLILDVRHNPPFPNRTQQVHITCRLFDDAGGALTASARYRVSRDNPENFATAAMFDDGLHQDGLAGDGTWGAALPAQENGTIIEFYVEASDGTSARTWPAAALSPGGNPREQSASANCFYQVDEEAWNGSQPVYRLIMSRPEGDDFVSSGYDKSEESDTDKNVTAIFAIGQDVSIHYQAGVRYRGAGSRGSYRPHNWKLNLPHDSPWNDWTNFNLNSLSAHTLVLGSRLMQSAGLPAELGTATAVRMNGSNRMVAGNPSNVAVFGLYSHQTPMGSEWVGDAIAADPDGNIYKKGRGGSGGWRLSESAPGVPNIQAYRSAGWFKETNVTENDWTDLNDFIRTIRAATSNATNPPSFDYEMAATVADLEQWARWWAFCVIINHRETNLSNGVDDDYSIYFRTADRKAMLLAHDFDTIFSAGDTSTSPTATIWQAHDTSFLGEKTFAAAGLDIPRALFYNNRFVRRFKFHLRDLLSSVFSQANFDAAVDRVLGVPTGTAAWVPQTERDRIKTFMEERRTHILGLLAAPFTATTSLTFSGGVPVTTDANVTGLSGTMDGSAIDQVLVNGVPAILNNRDNTWTAQGIPAGLSPGVNTVIIRALNDAGVETGRQTMAIFYNDGNETVKAGTLASSETWNASAGPYRITSTLTIPAGISLTLAPGTSVLLEPGAEIRFSPGSRLIAEGTPGQQIRFSRPPGGTGTWGGLFFDSAAEIRLSHAAFENYDNTAVRVQGSTTHAALDGLTFLNNTRGSLQLDGCSFEVSNCTFPSMAAGSSFAAIRGTASAMAGSRAIIRDSAFGAASGNNDVIKFKGGKRPGTILRVVNCTFNGSGDDILDLEGADAWIEGNVFTHVHRNGATDSAAAVMAGAGDGVPSQVTVLRNLIYDCDCALTVKQGSSFALLHNTIVRVVTTGGTETEAGVINFADTTDGTQAGAGGIVAENIIQETQSLTRQYRPASSTVTFTGNILPVAWSGPGSGNQVLANAMLNPSFIGSPANATVTQVRSALNPQPFSAAVGTSTNGFNKGASFPAGITASGVPFRPSSANSVTFTMAPAGTIAGPSPWNYGYTHYRYSTDGVSFSAETPASTPLSLTGLAAGTHALHLQGRDDSGVWQTTPSLLTWTVNPALPPVILSEILADNVAAYPLGTTRPDFVELHNYGASTLSLGGYGLSDNPDQPYKFTLPSGTQIPAGGYLVIAGDDLPSQAGELHTGFGLSSGGEVLRFTSPAGIIVDEVTFGFQVPDFTISRSGARMEWGLSTPTPGTANARYHDFGSAFTLRINEWLAANDFIVEDDFVEIYNPAQKPVEISGMLLTDNYTNYPGLLAQGDDSVHIISPLSFIRGAGFAAFKADGNVESGGDHLSFSLSRFNENLALIHTDGRRIDQVVISASREDISEGRTSDGSPGIGFFSIPTPGFSNATNLTTDIPLQQALRITEVMYNPGGSSLPEFIEFQNTGTTPLDLTGVRFTAGITFTFPAMTLAPNAYAVITSDAAAFAVIYPGIIPAGAYTGRLDNNGEQLRYELARYPVGILDFDYDRAWHPSTDGGGASLQIVDATRHPSTWNDRASWQPGPPSPGGPTAFGVVAGADQRVAFPGPAVLDGTVFPGFFSPAAITTAWTKVSGPGSVTFTAPASTETSATFSAPGQYELKLTATGPGPVTIQDLITVTVEESYTAWATRGLPSHAAADREMTADPDRDGLSNLAEYVFGTPPAAGNVSAFVPRVVNGCLALEYRRSATADSRITVIPEVSSDMVTWQSELWNITHSLESESGGIQTWLATDNELIVPGRKRYLRVKIVTP